VSEDFDLSKRARSFLYAGRGVLALVRSQPNARIHAVATGMVLVLGIALGVGRTEWAALVLAIALVWCAEAMNTSLEALCDRASPEYHPLIERAKDVAAAAVLLAALGAVAVGLLILGPPLWAWLR
jgi:diacylglycerol kinase